MPTRVLNYATRLQSFQNLFPMNRLTTALPLKAFGCITYVHVPSYLRGKFEPKSENVFS